MKLFDVYPLFDINIVKGKGCHVWDDKGTEYLDLYGGHAVISIGHAHPHYVEMISNQVARLGFYSNSVINKLQQEVADRLGEISGYDDYQLFLINSGASCSGHAATKGKRDGSGDSGIEGSRVGDMFGNAVDVCLFGRIARRWRSMMWRRRAQEWYMMVWWRSSELKNGLWHG